MRGKDAKGDRILHLLEEQENLDAAAMLSPATADALRSGSLFDLLYADDTILLGSDPMQV